MFKADPVVLRRMFKQLELARREHSAWYESVVRTIVCRLPCDPVEFADDHHQRCPFGTWCSEQASPELREQPVFAAIEVEHEQLHRFASALLQQSTAGQPVDCDDYDRFAASASRLRMGLDSLRHEVQAALRNTDALTGAYGRTEMIPELREWRQLARRDVQHCCLAFLDLDHLKEINDSHGHAVGDRVLTAAVRFLTAHLRPYDKVFRYGGDEFLVSLPGVDLVRAEQIMERVRDGLASTSVAVSDTGDPVRVTASFGLAMLDPEVSVEESIDRADKALLVAKSAGRNRIIAWDPSITTATMLQRFMAEETDERAP